MVLSIIILTAIMAWATGLLGAGLFLGLIALIWCTDRIGAPKR